MADSGINKGRGGEDEERGYSGSTKEPHGLSPMGTRRNLSRGIVIQLTGTEGEWDSPYDNELILSLDHDEDYPPVSLCKERQLYSEDDKGLKSHNYHVPTSPSTDSLGNVSTTGPSFLSPSLSSTNSRPLSNLVKSLSTELELKESSTLRPKPFLSLVKSISTELSRSEPEVSQSKSDSGLNLHLWKQLTQTKTRSSGDSRTAPPSPSSISPCKEGLKGGFFKTELEDTRRKLSEAMHEPLSSMFSKIMKEDSGGSPKHHSKPQVAHQSSCQSFRREGSTDTVLSESPVTSSRKVDGDHFPVFEWPSVRHFTRFHRSSCPVHPHRQRHREEELEICTDGEMMQVVAVETLGQKRTALGSQAVASLDKSSVTPSSHPLPRMSLFFVAVLSYGYFILPLSPYISGLALGLALGFLLGLLLIRMGSSKSSCSEPGHRSEQPPCGEGNLTGGFVSSEPDTLKAWMNEIHDYDPEICHPALTRTVFATLEGSCLRLDYPHTNISRRATYNERAHEATFVKTRCFQLAKSKVFLLPLVLARKRVWNPKYPICIQLAAGSELQEGERGGLENLEDELGAEPVQSHNAPTILYLFGRTGREKEEWFQHLLLASMDAEVELEKDGQRHGRCVSQLGNPAKSIHVPRSRGPSRMGSTDDDTPSTPPAPCIPTPPSNNTRGLSVLDYPSYMAQVLSAEEATPLSSPGVSSEETSPTIKGHCTCDQIKYPESGQTAWVNALIGRIFWDFLREKSWADVVSHKIQKKLSKIKLPYFMNELTLTELDMGCSMPRIIATSRPEVNHKFVVIQPHSNRSSCLSAFLIFPAQTLGLIIHGLWVDLQLVYTGNLQMTLQTKFNLSKLGKEGSQDMVHHLTDTCSTRSKPILDVLADSDEESSSAASSDEEELLLSEPHGLIGEKGTAATEGAGGGKTGKKILRLVDKIAKSKYFQRATENEFIKKKFEEMSNTPLLLTVEVRELAGTLAVNIPPPPTDRIWYSFCVPPKLELHVCPKLGEREVTFCHVTEWIEKKLQNEFQKVFVLPNMDDIYFPLMHSAEVNQQARDSPQS